MKRDHCTVDMFGPCSDDEVTERIVSIFDVIDQYRDTSETEALYNVPREVMYHVVSVSALAAIDAEIDKAFDAEIALDAEMVA